MNYWKSELDKPTIILVIIVSLFGLLSCLNYGGTLLAIMFVCPFIVLSFAFSFFRKFKSRAEFVGVFSVIAFCFCCFNFLFGPILDHEEQSKNHKLAEEERLNKVQEQKQKREEELQSKADQTIYRAKMLDTTIMFPNVHEAQNFMQADLTTKTAMINRDYIRNLPVVEKGETVTVIVTKRKEGYRSVSTMDGKDGVVPIYLVSDPTDEDLKME